MNTVITNPYVGPRPFLSDESHLFFGRDREVRELLSLIIVERLVLFHAQSGAGKSSLINTKLISDLRNKEEFEVFPVGRVSGKANYQKTISNIFVYNLLLSLNQDKPVESVKNMRLSKFLDNFVFSNGKHIYDENYHYDEDYKFKPRVLIIDQFEEILTAYPEAWDQQIGFFEQLRDAMHLDDQLWVVLSMREDHIAKLAPFAHILPGSLQSRYYMQRMTASAARDALEIPAKNAGRPFTKDAVDSLIKNLRQIRISRQDSVDGQYVELVQLQVVCQQIWDSLATTELKSIGVPDLEKLTKEQDLTKFIDNALGEFYERAIARVMNNSEFRSKVSEPELRDWFKQELITESNTRGNAHRGEGKTEGLDNSIVDFLDKKLHLLRAETRAGGIWYELVHDRFIEPILRANEEWRAGQPLMQLAQRWDSNDRQDGFLLSGIQLDQYLKENWQGLGELVQEFVTASIEFQTKLEEDQRQREEDAERLLNEEKRLRAEERMQAAEDRAREKDETNKRLYLAARRLRSLVIYLGIAGVVAIVAAGAAIRFAVIAANREDEAIAAQATAEAAEAELRETNRINNARSLADAAMTNSDPDVSVLYAIAAARLSVREEDKPVIKAHDALNRALQNSSPSRLLFDHQDQVVSVAFNAPGTLLATSSMDGQAIIWDTLSGELRQSLEIFASSDDSSFANNNFPIAFGQDENLATLAPDDGASIIIRNIGTGEEIKAIPSGHLDKIWSIAFSPNGQLLASADEGGVLKMWNLAGDDNPMWEIEAHNDAISGVTFSPNGLLLATASKDKTAKIWNVSSGDEVAVLDDHFKWVNRIAFVGDGSQIATASDDGSAKLWDYERDETIDLPEPYDDYIHGIAVGQADGKPRLAMVDNDGRVVILDKDAETGEWKITSDFPSRHLETVWNLALSRDGTHLVTVSEDGTAIIWPLDQPEKLHPIISVSSKEKEIGDLATSPEGHYLAAVTGEDQRSLQLLSFTENKKLDPIQFDLPITVITATLSADGAILATVNDGQVPQVWDIVSGKAENPRTLPSLVIATDASSSTATVPSPSKGNTPEPQQAEQAAKITKIALNGDGTRLAVEGLNAKIHTVIWDVKSGEELFTPNPENDGTALAFSPNEPLLARADTDKEVKVWNIETEELLFTLSPENEVKALAFNKDNTLLATADKENNNIQIWQLDSRKPESIMTFFSAENIMSLIFSPDSSQIIAARDDGTVRFYSLDIEKSLDIACQYTHRNLSWPEWQKYKRELGDEPEKSRICPNLPIDNSIVAELALQGDIQTSQYLLEGKSENSDAQIAQILLDFAEKQIRQYEYEKAFNSLEIAIDRDDEFRLNQTSNLATEYFRICRAGLIERYVRTACDRVIELTTTTENGSLSLNFCLQGLDAGLNDFERVCAHALEQPNVVASIVSNLAVCRRSDVSGISADLFSSVCRQAIESLPRIEFGPEILDEVESSQGDYWVFEGEQGQVVTIAMGGFDTYLELWEPDQLQTIIEDDEGGTGNYDSMIQEFTLPTNGLYIINARGYSGNTGNYSLRLTEEVVTPITPGQTVSANIANQTRWTFAGERGQIVTIAMETADSDFDPYLTLFSPSGQELTSDDDGGGGLNARIDMYLLAEEGTYLIRIGRTGADADYTLSITEFDLTTATEDPSLSLDICSQGIEAGLDDLVEPICTAILEQPDVDQLFASNLDLCRTTDGSGTAPELLSSVCRQAIELLPTIEFGDEISDEVESSQGDYWVFEGEQGQIVTIAMGGFDTYLELWEPDQLQTIIEDDDSGTGDYNSMIQEFILPRDGLYIINAHGYSGGTGPYTLSLTVQ